MCKHCDNIFDKSKDIIGFYFEKDKMFKGVTDDYPEYKRLAAIMDLTRDETIYVNLGPVLTVTAMPNGTENDWIDLPINYCPICGKQLRKKLMEENNE